MSDDRLNTAKKRLIWRATHRGTKEVDMLLGGFAHMHVPSMNADALAAFEDFLTIPDPTMHLIMTQKEPVPEGFPKDLVQAISEFRLPAPSLSKT